GNTSSRVPSALFDVQSGVRLEEVAYKDAVPAIQDLIGGRIHVTFPDLVIGESYVRSGQVRALAVTSAERAPQFPDLEAMAETYPGFEVIAFLSFTARKEVPVEIQKKLNGWIMEILHMPEVHKRLIEIGITPPPRDWDVGKCDAFVKRERVQWAKYIKLARIEPQ
ncbi:MAG TPA: tripartite tricarboxylate transporter substrate-binding protein, partial [Reyranella sp.]|nr:tripartite tricarboxylate transporter substrate-binding protein [Reyranella sp.]